MAGREWTHKTKRISVTNKRFRKYIVIGFRSNWPSTVGLLLRNLPCNLHARYSYDYFPAIAFPNVKRF